MVRNILFLQICSKFISRKIIHRFDGKTEQMAVYELNKPKEKYMRTFGFTAMAAGLIGGAMLLSHRPGIGNDLVRLRAGSAGRHDDDRTGPIATTATGHGDMTRAGTDTVIGRPGRDTAIITAATIMPRRGG
jgi:hypothetical protein